jgi:hypothetical protein
MKKNEESNSIIKEATRYAEGVENTEDVNSMDIFVCS